LGSFIGSAASTLASAVRPEIAMLRQDRLLVFVLISRWNHLSRRRRVVAPRHSKGRLIHDYN
jgi:hypothetical protein